MCFAPQRCALFDIWTSNNGASMQCLYHFEFDTCFVPQSRAHVVFCPESVWAKGSSKSGGLLYIFTCSHLHMFTCSHLLTFTYSHLHTCSASSHLHVLTSSRLHIFTHLLCVWYSLLCKRAFACVRHVCMYEHAYAKCPSQFIFLCLLRFIFLLFLLQVLHMYLLFLLQFLHMYLVITTCLRHVSSF